MACELQCPLKQWCEIQTPTRWNGKPLVSGIRTFSCAYITCDGGLNAAQKALKDDANAETITTVRGETIYTAHMYGTRHKPTHESYAAIHRWVTPDKKIYATAPDGDGIMFTGTTLDILEQLARDQVI